MINLTLPEIRRLLTRLVLRIRDTAEHVWAWSRWRRRRQHQARLSHYADAAIHSPNCSTNTAE